MRSRAAILVFLCAASLVTANPIQVALDRRALEEAIAIGQSSIESERTRFHAPYRVLVSRPPVDYLDIVTPFRRVVLVAEMRARLGDRRFGQAEALKVLDSGPMMIGVHVELTFHPLNTYVGVPEYHVTLVSLAGNVVAPSTIDRVARFGPRMEGNRLPYPFSGSPPSPPGRSLPLLGATIVADFDAGRLDSNFVNDIVVSEAKKEIARVKMELGGLR